jgi:hypothetical protein
MPEMMLRLVMPGATHARSPPARPRRPAPRSVGVTLHRVLGGVNAVGHVDCQHQFHVTPISLERTLF